MSSMEKNIGGQKNLQFEYDFFHCTEAHRQKLAAAIRSKEPEALTPEERAYRKWLDSFPKDDQPREHDYQK
jgi:hypothetical protein